LLIYATFAKESEAKHEELIDKEITNLARGRHFYTAGRYFKPT
jgi:hypothetical protein